MIDNTYTFEVGGRSKNIATGIEKSYFVSTNIEIGANNKVPLWLFGFIY